MLEISTVRSAPDVLQAVAAGGVWPTLLGTFERTGGKQSFGDSSEPHRRQRSCDLRLREALIADLLDLFSDPLEGVVRLGLE